MFENTVSTLDFSASTSLERGMQCFRDEDYAGAVGSFSLALIGDPENVEVYARRAEAYFRLEEYQKSYDDATRALALVPDDPTALFRRGTLLAMHGHLEESLADLDGLLRLDRDHVDARLRRFAVLTGLGRTHAADEDLRNALILIPDETPRQLDAAVLCLRSDRPDAARTLLSAVLTREPEHVGALKLRGLAWRSLGVPDMAVSDLSFAVDATEEPDAELLVERAAALVEMGKRTLTKRAYKQALDDLTRALDDFPQQSVRPAVVRVRRAEAWTLFADRCWFDKSGYQKAIDDYTEAIRLEPDLIDAYRNRAALYWKLGNADKVIEDCHRVVAANPEDVDALHLRAEAFLQSGEAEKAEADFREIDRIHETRSALQKQATEENRKACEGLAPDDLSDEIGDPAAGDCRTCSCGGACH